jgi:hypothetical protein
MIESSAVCNSSRQVVVSSPSNEAKPEKPVDNETPRRLSCSCSSA